MGLGDWVKKQRGSAKKVVRSAAGGPITLKGVGSKLAKPVGMAIGGAIGGDAGAKVGGQIGGMAGKELAKKKPLKIRDLQWPAKDTPPIARAAAIAAPAGAVDPEEESAVSPVVLLGIAAVALLAFRGR